RVPHRGQLLASRRLGRGRAVAAHVPQRPRLGGLTRFPGRSRAARPALGRTFLVLAKPAPGVRPTPPARARRCSYLSVGRSGNPPVEQRQRKLGRSAAAGRVSQQGARPSYSATRRRFCTSVVDERTRMTEAVTMNGKIETRPAGPGATQSAADQAKAQARKTGQEAQREAEQRAEQGKERLAKGAADLSQAGERAAEDLEARGEQDLAEGLRY